MIALYYNNYKPQDLDVQPHGQVFPGLCISAAIYNIIIYNSAAIIMIYGGLSSL